MEAIIDENIRGDGLMYSVEFTTDRIIPDKNRLLNTRLFDFILSLYMVGLILQYILIFASVPFDRIENRPTMCLVSTICCFIMFCINAGLFPVLSSNSPSRKAMRCLLTSLCLQVTNLILSSISAGFCLQTAEMFFVEFDQALNGYAKIDVTLYIKIITLTMLSMNFLTTLVLLWAGILEFKALSNLVNMIDPQFARHPDNRMVTIPDSLPLYILAEQSRLYRA